MKRSRFTEEQIITVRREQEAGMKTADICRKHGVSEATFYNFGRLTPCKLLEGCFWPNRCQHLSGIAGHAGAPKRVIRRARASISGRSRRPLRLYKVRFLAHRIRPVDPFPLSPAPHIGRLCS